MLIRHAVLDEIMAGRVDLVFRRQKRPTVRTGGTLRTARGMLDIVGVEPVDPPELTEQDARRAGHGSLDELIAELTSKPEGTFYRIEVRPGGEDPLIALRNDDDLSAHDLAELVAALERMDGGPEGPWTATVLGLIADRPRVRAPELAESLGWETKPFKAKVRRLKALGLTISHNPGYELSPRGRALMAHRG